jgi:pyruvate dehydrogenase E2 component (dihydrolipoamide acetyltransferase)
VPLYVAVGAIRDVPAAWEGRVALRPQVVITATLDHRFVDGAQAAQLARVMRARFANPWPLVGLEGPPEDAPPPVTSVEEPRA